MDGVIERGRDRIVMSYDFCMILCPVECAFLAGSGAGCVGVGVGVWAFPRHGWCRGVKGDDASPLWLLLVPQTAWMGTAWVCQW
jgi:hypothetical protein